MDNSTKRRTQAYFDEQTAQDLEFDLIREMLAEYCVGPTARKTMEGLRTYSTQKQARTKLEEVDELRARLRRMES